MDLFSCVIPRWRLWKLLTAAIALVASVQVWLGAALPAQATGVYSFPVSVDRSSYVIDEAEILSRLNETNISGQLGSLAKKTGSEVRFVTIHRLDYGETIDSFADQLFDQWFPTPAAKANQTLIVLDEVTNTTAIRKGDDTPLTDEIATSIAQETMQVPLRDGDKYNQAFADASDRLVAVLSGQPDPGPPIVESNVQTKGTFATAEQTKAGASNYIGWVIGLLIAATVIPMATYYLYLVGQPAPSEPSDSSDS